VAVVVNPSNPTSNISQVDLRKIFAGQRRTWERGVRIKLIVRPPGCRERLVLLKLLGMSESEYKQYWAAQVFRGEADSEPFAAPSIGMQKEAMKVFPGAISLVVASDVKEGMKIIKLDGLLPGAAGYPLH
jgi:ABC-type phosphate transport system substrate-binding protein